MKFVKNRKSDSLLTVGELAKRSGVAVSALHFYEKKGLIRSERGANNHRYFPREVLRSVAVIKVAQRVGIPLKEISDYLSSLPNGRTPTTSDWRRVSQSWQADLDKRIEQLQALRNKLNSCIGCGCLSVRDCPLRNPSDDLAQQGSGPQLLQLKR